MFEPTLSVDIRLILSYINRRFVSVLAYWLLNKTGSIDHILNHILFSH